MKFFCSLCNFQHDRSPLLQNTSHFSRPVQSQFEWNELTCGDQDQHFHVGHLSRSVYVPMRQARTIFVKSHVFSGHLNVIEIIGNLHLPNLIQERAAS